MWFAGILILFYYKGLIEFDANLFGTLLFCCNIVGPDPAVPNTENRIQIPWYTYLGHSKKIKWM